jgi:hypothetical protein
MNEARPVAVKAGHEYAGRLALAGMFLAIAGGVSYFLLIDVPWIRSRAIPNIAAVVLGLGLCAYALIQRRSKSVIAATVPAALVGIGFLLSFFALMRLPKPTLTMETAQVAPDFTLPNHRGEPVTLSSWRGRGPVLLVFYRGFW